MASDRKSGAGALASGVLERIAPHRPAEADDAAEPAEAPEAPRGRAGREPSPARKPRAGGKGRGDDVKGRTIYLPETLFERIMVQAHRKRKTISEYVTAILERQVPDYRTTRADSGDIDAA